MSARLTPAPSFVNVREHGAAPGIADSTLGLQRALNVGGHVYVPGGAYTITSELTIYSNTHLDLAVDASINLVGYGGNGLVNQAVNGTGRDSNITVTGGAWTRDDHSSDAHFLKFRRLDGLYVGHTRITTLQGKYAINPGDATGCTFEDLDFDVISAAIQGDGPCTDILVSNVRGTTADDAIAFGSCGHYYPQYDDTDGNFENITIEKINFEVTGLAACIHIWTADGYTIKHVRIDGVQTNCIGGHIVKITGDDLSPLGIDDITIRNVSGTTGTVNHGYSGVYFGAGHSGTITVDGLTVDENAVIVDSGSGLGGTQIDTLAVSHITMAPNSSYTGVELPAAGAVVHRLVVSDSVVTLTTNHTAGALLGIGPAQVDVAEFNNVTVTGGQSAIATYSTQPMLLMANNLAFEGTVYCLLFGASGPVTVLANCVAYDSPGGILFLLVAAANVSVVASSLFEVSGSFEYVVSGGHLRVNGLTARLNVADIVTPLVGDMAYNTNAGLGCGVGPVVSNGTHWKHVYSGATT